MQNNTGKKLQTNFFCSDGIVDSQPVQKGVPEITQLLVVIYCMQWNVSSTLHLK